MTIWIASLLLMLTLVMLGKRKSQSQELSYVVPPQDLGEFVRDTLYTSFGRFSHLVHKVRPHISRVTQVFVVVGKKGHDTFTDRVFGKMNVGKGSASSFFLKNIAEYKAEAKKDGDARNGY